MPEIVSDGMNGFLVQTLDDATGAVEAVSSLDRRKVRDSVENRFTVERMVDRYIKVYRQLVR
jgi:glycosyltransferase involved in cell wall biosynthesis